MYVSMLKKCDAQEAEATSALAHMAVGRCAMGAAALGGRLVVCGGYDRARVLRAAEAYDADADRWVSLPDMKRARARFPAARLGDALFALGGSDGQVQMLKISFFISHIISIFLADFRS